MLHYNLKPRHDYSLIKIISKSDLDSPSSQQMLSHTLSDQLKEGPGMA